MAIAKLLEKHPKIEKVLYPGLKSYPYYALAKRQCNGSGAMLSFYVKGNLKTATNFFKQLKVVTLAESLGGVESLINHPALMTHRNVSPENRKALGIHENFIRMSVGIETQEDLLADLKNALDKC